MSFADECGVEYFSTFCCYLTFLDSPLLKRTGNVNAGDLYHSHSSHAVGFGQILLFLLDNLRDAIGHDHGDSTKR